MLHESCHMIPNESNLLWSCPTQSKIRLCDLNVNAIETTMPHDQRLLQVHGDGAALDEAPGRSPSDDIAPVGRL